MPGVNPHPAPFEGAPNIIPEITYHHVDTFSGVMMICTRLPLQEALNLVNDHYQNIGDNPSGWEFSGRQTPCHFDEEARTHYWLERAF